MRPVARIHCSSLESNLQRVRLAAPQSQVLAVIKANGYGHGMLRVAQYLKNADGFAVASLEEGIKLRENCVQHPIVLLAGVFDLDELILATQHHLQPVIHHRHQIALLKSYHPKTPIPIWLKLDSGMHRLGFAPKLLPQLWDELKNVSSVGKIHLMSHFANANDRSNPLTGEQIGRFNRATAAFSVPQSLANSAAVLAWPQSHKSWVRPGIMLYGVSPFQDGLAQQHKLKPVMELNTRLLSIQSFSKGDSIGYGSTWTCPEDMNVGIAAIGYGDGYPRQAKSGTPVLLNGRRVALIGRVSMDSIYLDLRTQPGAKIGDTVSLWGPQLPIEEVAASSDTIAYQLLCQLTGRVRFQEV